eukprot:scaffold8853_cov18-Tisochrysis_lutea.AAC.1
MKGFKLIIGQSMRLDSAGLFKNKACAQIQDRSKHQKEHAGIQEDESSASKGTCRDSGRHV